MLPATSKRVPKNTKSRFNDAIAKKTEANIKRYSKEGQPGIEQRLQELDREWDVERTLETNASTLILTSLALSLIDRRWLWLTAGVSAFLLQHGLQGWCPPLPVLRRLGMRTEHEIEKERYALKAARGDFQNVKKEKNGRRFSEIMEAVNQ